MLNAKPEGHKEIHHLGKGFAHEALAMKPLRETFHAGPCGTHPAVNVQVVYCDQQNGC